MLFDRKKRSIYKANHTENGDQILGRQQGPRRQDSTYKLAQSADAGTRILGESDLMLWVIRG